MGLTFTAFISTIVPLLPVFIFAAFTDSLKIYLRKWKRFSFSFTPQPIIFPFTPNKEKDSFWLSYNDRTFCTDIECLSDVAKEV